MYVAPVSADFKNKFARDFPYGTDSSHVMDSDVLSALGDAALYMNPNLFPDQDSFTLCYLLCAAHFLVMNIRASSQGLGGQFNWLQSGKGASGVSESFQIPQHVAESPELSMFSKTHYGAKFLHFVLPFLRGHISSVPGRTHA